jgi:hypothetical protein
MNFSEFLLGVAMYCQLSVCFCKRV